MTTKTSDKRNFGLGLVALTALLGASACEDRFFDQADPVSCETDADCDVGEACGAEGACVVVEIPSEEGCKTDADCATGKVCASSGECADPPASCSDGALNGSETDTDCGGGECVACVAGDTCQVARDCQGSVCDAGVCACPPGFSADAAGACSDIDECAAETHDCSADATCENLPGSYSCACNDGFSGDGVSCVDNDECLRGSDTCDENAVCANVAGSFDCTCNTGWTGDGYSCADEDECTLGTDDCSADAACTNTLGSFECACNDGFSGDGVVCDDDDECTLGTTNCDPAAICTNTPGSFSCACPPAAIDVHGDGTSCLWLTSCQAILDHAPGSPSGTYTIDPDGAGPEGQLDVHCDMTHEGGGWTNLDFAQNRVILENGIFIQCGALTATETSITCDDPMFNGSPTGWLYHFYCDGSDISGNYLIEEVGPLLGLRGQTHIGGWTGLNHQHGDSFEGSLNDEEYCYVDGQIALWNEPLCAPYALQNGNCVPGIFTLTL